MKKKKWNRVLAVLLVMVTVISLLSGCGWEERGKRRCRNDHGVFMEHKPV